MNTAIVPVALSGWGVRLEPMAPADAGALRDASDDGELWALNYTGVPGPDAASVAAYIQAALAGQASGAMLPFVVRDEAGRVLGSTRYYDIAIGVPTLAVGYTWYRA